MLRTRFYVAAKYKAYARLKSGTSKSTEQTKRVKSKEPEPPPTYHEAQTTKHSSRKRGSPDLDESHISTPRKAPRQDFVTPSKPPSQRVHPSQLDPYDSPSTLRKLFNPKSHQGDGYQSSSPLPLRTAIGPTPQRDGKALGLFDLLSASGGSRAEETPSGRKSGIAQGEIAQTPSKQRTVALPDGNEEEATPRVRKHSLTPVSTGRRFLYSNFVATPITLRYSKMGEEGGGKPGGLGGLEPSVSGTPSFLRRTNALDLSKNANGDMDSISPMAVRMPQKLFGKGLSDLVQGLRDIEDEKLDDDLDVLRELEMEQMNNSNDAVVGDSQNSGIGDDGVGDLQHPIKQWKKKGQKRTTRRVNIKPTRSKPKPEPKWKANIDDIEEESEGGDEGEPTVLETQLGNQDADADPESDYGSLSGIGMSDMENDDHGDSDYNEGNTSNSTTKNRKTKVAKDAESNVDSSNAKKSKADKKKPKKEREEEKENAKPKGRKVNPLAHANFRSLKIQNRGSKRRGRGGRFGRI